MVAVIDPPAFNHQVVALRIARQALDRRGGHRSERGFAAVDLAIDHVAHVAEGKEAEQGLVVRSRCHILERGRVGTAGRSRPFARKVGGIVQPAPAFVLAVEGDGAAAQRDIERRLNQLPRDIDTALPALVFGDPGIGLPVARHAARIDRCRRSVRQPRGADDTQRKPPRLDLFAEHGRRMPRSRSAIALRHAGAVAEHADVGFHTCMHRAGRARAVGDLCIDIVGLHQGHIIEGLERQDIFLAGLAELLAGIDPRGGDGRNPHPVADEEDDVLGPLFGWNFSRKLRRLLRGGGRAPSQHERSCGGKEKRTNGHFNTP